MKAWMAMLRYLLAGACLLRQAASAQAANEGTVSIRSCVMISRRRGDIRVLCFVLMVAAFFGVIALSSEYLLRLLDWSHYELLTRRAATYPVSESTLVLRWLCLVDIVAGCLAAFLLIPIATVVILVRIQIRIARNWLAPSELQQLFGPLRSAMLIGPYVERSLQPFLDGQDEEDQKERGEEEGPRSP